MGAIGFRRGVLLKKINASGAVNLVGNLLPNWTGTPVVPTINVGVAGSYTLPVTGATTVTWKAPGSKPAWLTFSGALMSWTNAATVQTLSGVVLTANNVAGPADSAPFNMTVVDPDSPPVWGTPAPAFTQGVASSYPLPVSDPNGDTITVTGTVPSGFAIAGLTLTYNGVVAAGSFGGIQLTATANGKSTASPTFTITVAAAPAVTTGLWGTEYDYSAANWRLYRRDYTTRITYAEGALHDVAKYNFPICNAKDNVAIYRPTTGRVYTFGGDQQMWNMNLEGFTTTVGKSNNVIFASFSEANPTWIAREAGFPNSQSEMFAQMDDCPSGMYDSVNDRILFFASSTFGSEWEGQAIISPVALVNANTARFAATPAQVPVNTKLKFLMTVGANADVFKRGRVASVTDVGGGQVEVTLTWWDTLTSFQSPTGVLISRPSSNNSSPTGAWQEANLGAEYYNESTGKWYVPMLAMDFTTRQVSRLLFEVAARGECGGERWSAKFLPASVTGRGNEVWSFSGGGALTAAVKFDFATMRATKYTTSLFGDTGTWGYTTGTNLGCADQKGNIYFFAPGTNPTRLVIVNVRGAVPTFTWVNTDYPTRLMNTTMPWAAYRSVWNEEIQRIELYAMENGGTVVDGECSIFLINPATNPAKVERVGNTDANGRKISGSTVVHVPTTGSSPAHTWMMGGDGAAVEACSRSRIFIAANRRKWEGLSAGSHWYHSFDQFNPKTTDADSTFTQIASVPAPMFGNWVPEINSSGLHTGKVYIRAGGDGDYGGNEVTILRLDQLSGTTFPTQLNTVTSSADFALWHNRIRTGFQQGGTTGARELLINPANPAEWAPVSIHTQYLNSFVPGYGYVEDWISPTSLSTSGPRHLRSAYNAYAIANNWWLPGSVTATRLADSGYPDANWGENYGMAQALGGVSESLNFWSELGANAGKWQRAVINSGELNGSKRLAEYNTDRGVLLGFKSGAGNMARIFEWTPGAAGFVQIRDVYDNQVVGNDFAGAFEVAGNNEAAITWISGDTYLVRRQAGGRCGFVTYVRGGSVTRNKGANGNAICDAADTAGAMVAVCPDRVRGEVFWIVGQGSAGGNRAVKVYRSPIGDLWNWREMYVANSSEILFPGNPSADLTAVIGIKPAFVAGDYIYLGTTVGQPNYGPSFDIPALKVWRIPIY